MSTRDVDTLKTYVSCFFFGIYGVLVGVILEAREGIEPPFKALQASA